MPSPLTFRKEKNVNIRPGDNRSAWSFYFREIKREDKKKKNNSKRKKRCLSSSY
jgi:uncharacterized Zn finger protein